MYHFITIPDNLIQEALQLTGLRSKREVIELSLKTLVQLKRQEEIRQYRGKLHWEGNLEQSRQTQ